MRVLIVGATHYEETPLEEVNTKQGYELE